MMKTSITLLCAFTSTILVHAQSSVDSGGDTASSATGNVSYSIGQTFYEPIIAVGGSTSPGVQQPYEITQTLGQEIAEINLSLQVYPNPTTDFLNLKIDLDDYQKYSCELYDLAGRALSKKTIVAKRTELSMSQYPAGTYLLKITKGKTPVKIFKVIKN